MVYVYAKKSELDNYLKETLSVEEIEESLKEMGLDLKGISQDKDPELKIELTAEKMDMISVAGIARALNFYRGALVEIPEYSLGNSGVSVQVNKETSKVRGKVVAAIVKNVPMTQKFLDEIIEIQEKIHASFGRQRKKAAIGIYPIEQISFPITYSLEHKDKLKFRPLMAESEMSGSSILEEHELGKKYAHLLEGSNEIPVFRDSEGKVLSLPPIINSYNTGRVDVCHRDLFVECTGHNLQHLDAILKVLVTTFIEMGAKAESVSVEYEGGEEYSLDLDSTKDSFSLSYVNSLLGTDISSEEIPGLLRKMMYSCSDVKGDLVEFEIPCFRSDVFNDVDVADDIARAYGYNNIVPKFPQVASIASQLEHSHFKNEVAQVMVNLGFVELYTYMLSSSDLHFKKMGREFVKNEVIMLQDSEDQGINMIRDSLLPDMLESLFLNRKHKYPQKVFEVGWSIVPDLTQETSSRDELQLGVAIADPKSNYTEVKQVLDSLSQLFELDFEVREVEDSKYILGRAAEVYFRHELVGSLGELHPQVLDNFGFLVPISTLELNLEKIFNLM